MQSAPVTTEAEASAGQSARVLDDDQVFVGLGDGPHVGAAEDANYLAPGTGGVGERPEQIEDRAERQLGPHGGYELHRRVVRAGEHEADAGLFYAFANLLRP